MTERALGLAWTPDIRAGHSRVVSRICPRVAPFPLIEDVSVSLHSR